MHGDDAARATHASGHSPAPARAQEDADLVPPFPSPPRATTAAAERAALP